MIEPNVVVDIQDVFFRCLEAAKKWIIKVGPSSAFMPAGHNGPHYALETPVRNTCHWIVAYLIAERLGIIDAQDSPVEYLRNWLLLNNVHFRDGMYVMRQSKGVDYCNGVIGAAWLLEALVRLGKYKRDLEAEKIAKLIYDKYAFSVKHAAWHRYDSINGKFGIDYTFDHQAWFASALAESGLNGGDVEAFLTACIGKQFYVNKDGRVGHLYNCSSFKGILSRIRYALRERMTPGFQEYLEAGYQIYSLFPMARIFQYHNSHPFFNSDKLRRACGYCTYENILALENNRYGYSYNSPGIEILLLHHVFHNYMGLSAKDVDMIWNKQKEYSLDPEIFLWVRNCSDPATLSARIYELGLFLEMLPATKVA